MSFLRTGPFARTGNPYSGFVAFDVLAPVNHKNNQLENWRWRYWDGVSSEFEDPSPDQLKIAPLNGQVSLGGEVIEIDPLARATMYFGYVASLPWSLQGNIEAFIANSGFASLRVDRVELNPSFPVVNILETYAEESDETFFEETASVSLDLSTVEFPPSQIPVFIFMTIEASGFGGPRPATATINFQVTDLT